MTIGIAMRLSLSSVRGQKPVIVKLVRPQNMRTPRLMKPSTSSSSMMRLHLSAADPPSLGDRPGAGPGYGVGPDRPTGPHTAASVQTSELPTNSRPMF